MTQKQYRPPVFIFPIFPSTKQEKKLLWESVNRLPLFYLGIQNFISARNETVHVITDQYEVVGYLKKKRIPCIYYEKQDTKAVNRSLCRLAHHCVSYLISLNKDYPDSLIIFIDYKSPMISYEIIQNAMSQYWEFDSPVLISLAADRDHPSQFLVYFDILDTDLIGLFDDHESSDWNNKSKIWDDQEISFHFQAAPLHGFHFDWYAHGVPETTDERRLFYKKYDTMTPVLFPLDANHTIDGTNLYLFYKHADRAVRLIPKKTLQLDSGLKFSGYSCLRPVNLLGSFLTESRKTNGFDIYINSYLYADTKVIRKWAVNQKSEIISSSDIELVSSGPMEQLRYNGATFLGPFEFHPKEPEIKAFAIAMLKSVDSGRADFAEPAIAECDFWGYDSDTHVMLNTITGKNILGRQDFPETYVKDHSFCMFKQEDMDALVASGESPAGYILDDTGGFKVNNTVDLVKLKIQLGIV